MFCKFLLFLFQWLFILFIMIWIDMRYKCFGKKNRNTRGCPISCISECTNNNYQSKLIHVPHTTIFFVSATSLKLLKLGKNQDTMFRCANYMYKEIQIPLFFRKYCPIYSLNFDHLSNKVMNSLKAQLLLNHCMEFGKTYVFRTWHVNEHITRKFCSLYFFRNFMHFWI